MKYPQLVSTRAVNAISDWLVSRLEQLGVEAPPIYSRLLLSLLHSSVQINDPIEFNNLETYLANRKGSKRVPPCDTETLKKFTAVQCLVDAVSSEQEISKIENLVDELCEKLSDIEKQSNEEDLHQIPTTLKTLDIEDPRKRYYRAFPALSKEMEDSVWMSKRNTKSLTWPTGNSGTSSSNVGALSNTAGVKRKPKRRRNQVMSKGKLANAHKNSFGDNNSPTWDTDFEGAWEMGHDLIKEFITNQNKRNRSISESDACNLRIEEERMKPINNQSIEQCEEIDNYIPPPPPLPPPSSSSSATIKMDYKDDNIVPSTKSTIIKKSYSTSKTQEMQLPNDDGYKTYDDPTLLPEVDGTSNMMARRLYERDVTNNENINDLSPNISSEQNDFAQFEAKFNSSVEALWRDSSNELPSTLPNQQNIDNFWTNYYNHHYDENRFGNNNENTLKDDFFSMPANFGKADDTATGNIKCGSSTLGGNKLPGENFTSSSGGVFMGDSIWSDNLQKNYEEDDSFYASVLGSTYKNDGKNDITAYDGKDQPHPFSILKWSECSFETPFIPSSNEASGYRQPVAPASNNNKNNSPQSPLPISLPDFYGSLALAEKSYSKPAATAPIPVTTVSLTNHSKTSGFVEYAYIKTSLKTESIIKNDLSGDRRNTRPAPPASPTEDENLLTAERTHFRPIKQSYADGHEFDISSSFDEVDFERSGSGYLYLDSEKYMEYTVKDAFISDEDIISSSNENRKEPTIFPLKFRVKQNDVQCQTEDTIEVNDCYVLKPQKRDINLSANENKDEVDSVMCDNLSYLNDEASINLDQWTMAEIGKKCLDNNNSHTLWGMCPACNLDKPSVPANRLLKNELIIEGDEIMSDLKYMQDLYICSDWEDDEDDTDTDTDIIKDCDVFDGEDSVDEEQEQIFYNITKLISDLLKPENAKSLADALSSSRRNNKFRGVCNEDEMSDCDNSNNANASIQDIQTTSWKSASSNNNNNNNNNNNEKYVGGLWTNDENIIWKKEQLKPYQSIWPRNHDNMSASFLDKLNWKYTNLAEIWNNTGLDKQTSQSTLTSENLSKHIDQKLNCSEIYNRNLKNLISWNISQQNNLIQTDRDERQIYGDLRNRNVNRSDRKRRHSASQNINCSGGTNDLYDMTTIGNKIEIMAKKELDYGTLTSINDSPATIITCKVNWTTMDTTLASPFFMDKSSHYDGISAMAINPSSILKHVTVVSRPLTR